jgi:hypothetical protein
MTVNFITQALTVNGGSNGTVTVASTTGFVVGAIVYLQSSTQDAKELVVSGILSTTQLQVKESNGFTYNLFDCSGYLTTDNATITQSGISASIPAVGSPTIIPNLIVTNNAQVPTPATNPEAATKSYVDSALGGISSDKIYSALGAGATDIVTKAGSTVADASVNDAAKLLSIRTGINGTESEKAYVLKDGTVVNNGIAFGKFVSNRADGFMYNTGTAYLGITNANGAAFLGINLGTGSSYSSNQIEISSTLKLRNTGRIDQSGTNSSGTPGAATIDKPTGISAIASGASSVVITNSLATTTCKVMITWLGNHGQTNSWVTRASGSFTVNLNGAAASDTTFAWEVSELI